MASSRTPTIEDVAHAAGVSRAAVSKVLRDAYGVSDSMRATVHAAIESLGYRPRVSARGMRGSTFTIGIVLPSLSSPFFADISAGIDDELAATNYRTILASSPEDDRLRSSPVENLIDRQVDGLIILSPLVNQSWLETVAQYTPTVVLARHDDSVNYDTLVGNDDAGTALLMQHLLELGHSRIVHITQQEAGSQVSGTPHSVRRQRYEAEMRDAGLDRNTRVVYTRFEEEAAYASTLELFASEELPTAIFAGADEAAFGVLRALAELPDGDAQRIAVAGYDNTRFARHPRMSLTSVDQGGHELGRRAAALILERIEGRTEALHESLEPTLHIRDSTQSVTSPASAIATTRSNEQS